jgi:segregation and condensation protein A
MANQVSLDIFEGPLDLLLYLIKKEDLDINDIPISTLLNEYIQFIELAKDLDIDLGMQDLCPYEP